MQASDFSNELEKFCDLLAPGFAGFPGTRDDARDKWADAFEKYISGIAPSTVLITTYAATARQAFHDKLQLAIGMNVAVAAVDLANAWYAGLNTFVGGAVLPAFVKWSPSPLPSRTTVDDGWALLVPALIVALTAPGLVATTQLTNIAQAIHSVTAGISYVSSTGPATFT